MAKEHGAERVAARRMRFRAQADQRGGATMTDGAVAGSKFRVAAYEANDLPAAMAVWKGG